jgi:hypothetical protein
MIVAPWFPSRVCCVRVAGGNGVGSAPPRVRRLRVSPNDKCQHDHHTHAVGAGERSRTNGSASRADVRMKRSVEHQRAVVMTRRGDGSASESSRAIRSARAATRRRASTSTTCDRRRTAAQMTPATWPASAVDATRERPSRSTADSGTRRAAMSPNEDGMGTARSSGGWVLPRPSRRLACTCPHRSPQNARSEA